MLNATQKRILTAICRNGGEYQSIFRLSIQLEIHYVTAWRNVRALQISGHLRVEVAPAPGGRAARMALPCPDPARLPSWWLGTDPGQAGQPPAQSHQIERLTQRQTPNTELNP